MSGTPATSGRERFVRDAESGQALVLFAILIMAIMAMLAIGIDLAVVIGAQRRFDQNGADASALAVGQLLAGNASPSTSGVYFGIADEVAYATARRYGGMQSSSADWDCLINPHPNGTSQQTPPWKCVKPTGTNQNPGLTARSTLAVSLEYWGTREWGATWCYSPTGPKPVRLPALPTCTPFDSNPLSTTDLPTPPQPAANLPFKVRVTVSSTVTGFFAGVVGMDSGVPAAPALNNNASPACIRPQRFKASDIPPWQPLSETQAPGRTTCAHAVVVVSGAASTEVKPVIPITTNDCRVSGQPGRLYELWEQAPRAGCPGDPMSPMGSFKNMLDFSDEPLWCDGGGGYDYTYVSLTPTDANCGGTSQWNRAGYAHDPGHPGGNGAVPDVPYWLGLGGYPGTVRPDSCHNGVTSCSTDGNWFPTYVSASGQTGNYGSNVSDALYCKPADVTNGGNNCVASTSPAGTYFFALNRLLGAPSSKPICPDDFGAQYGYGCRDAGVLTWVDPQVPSGGSWIYEHSNPDRVRGARILTFRLYCQYNGSYCTEPPSAFSSAASVAIGRFKSNAVAGPGTGLPPSLNGNHIGLE